jgi:hypothetical protein
MKLEFEEGPKPEIRRPEMNEGQDKQNNLLDTTDCLEAMGVFKFWKNLGFVVIILLLLLLQAVFWSVNTGFIKVDDGSKTEASAAAGEKTEQTEETAKQAAKEPNQPTKAVPQKKVINLGVLIPVHVRTIHLSLAIRIFNFVLALAAVLYCLTMLFSIKVSLIGRLGGINHICRAFFLSLAFLVLLLPWQRFFAGVVAGAIYTPEELLSRCVAVKTSSIFGTALFYFRFTGLWLLAVLLLISAQLRSCRWARAILRRLEVI